MRPIRFKLFGHFWRLFFVSKTKLYDRKSGEQLDGICSVPADPDHKLTASQRTIYVRDDLDDEDLLETVLHETDHAADAKISEEYVDHKARVQARLLIKLGFHR